MLRLANNKFPQKIRTFLLYFHCKHYYDYLKYFQANVIYILRTNIYLLYPKVSLFNKLYTYNVKFIFGIHRA